MEITAIDPYWSAGTATLSTSSATMTGQGSTQWLANVVPGDMVIGADGRIGGYVQTVNSNTSITLAHNWRGSNQTAGAYTIHRVSDSVRVEQFSQRLINLLTGGTLSSLGGLTGAANLLPYFTGAGTMGTTAITSAARALLGDATVPRSGTGGSQHRTNIQNDERFNRPATVGWGSTGGLVTIVDASVTDNSILSGIYAYTTSSSGGPSGVSFGTLIHVRRSSGGGESQVVIADSGSGDAAGSIWYRTRVTGSWSGWRRLDILFSSNANGSFIRVPGANFQICWQSVSDFASTTVAQGNIFTSNEVTWTFPASFSSPPSCNGSVRTSANRWMNLRPTSSSAAAGRLFSPASSSATTGVDMIAMGLYQ